MSQPVTPSQPARRDFLKSAGLSAAATALPGGNLASGAAYAQPAGGLITRKIPRTGEISVGDFATAMGITDSMFVCNKIWSTGEFLAEDSHARRSFEQSQQRLWREKIDVMQVHGLVNVDQIVPVLEKRKCARAW